MHHCIWTDAALRKDKEQAKQIADLLAISVPKLWQGFKAHKKTHTLVLLHVEIEVRDKWDPEAGNHQPSCTGCKIKKLSPAKPKYWFETIDRPKTASFDKSGKNSA